MTAEKVKKSLQKFSSKEKAKTNAWFFKTGKGEYGEGDKFIGVTLPEQRSVAKNFKDLSFSEIKKLLDSEVHEHRLTGLVILSEKIKQRDPRKSGDDGVECKEIFNFYLKNLKAVNNWDLVDDSAPKIVGNYLLSLSAEGEERKVLYELAKSNNLWKQRIAIVSTWSFIRKGEFEDTLKISEILLKHEHDLIHKAVGWMLREVGKKDDKVLKQFLKKHYKNMPRTMLRYSIEKFSEDLRQKYLKNLI